MKIQMKPSVVAAALFGLGLAPTALTAQAPQSRIALATSAAPSAIGADASIVEFQADGSVVELRSGTNGWLCWPDDPSTPGDDPACSDSSWQSFFEAYMSQTPPEIDRLGISYMLRGSKSASNSDPFAMEPLRGEQWLEDGPHLMLIVPDSGLLEGLPTEHDGYGGPYVMFKGTPYAHVMVPVSGR